MAKPGAKGDISRTSSGQLSPADIGARPGEHVVEIPLNELNAPDPHPFLVSDDDAMTQLAESVRRFGVREPGLARPLTESGFELLCGNRRKRACEIVGLDTLPVIVRELDDCAAAVAMVDSNLLQREKLLLSEKAWAYRVKLEALNHSGVRAEANSVDVLVEQTGESKNQIFRLIRLTELVDNLLDKADTRQLAFNTAVELSYLSYDEQQCVAEAMEQYEVRPSLSQAIRLKKLKQSGKLTEEVIGNVLAETKESPLSENIIRLKYRKFFPAEYSPKQVENTIIALLRDWQKAQLAH
ncbi:MAG: ParB N-terminal domain-containing protein [Oscillospiraceae bacterium]|jgi:ParB family chromosome partitioning protein|nr:ParB N-terminal domain-containing protein [Oscillospiraceae bacterium]